ncbi:MAG: type II CAAX endopeptidase family protein [Pirellulales bacterium]
MNSGTEVGAASRSANEVESGPVRSGWWLVALGIVLPSAVTWLYFVVLHDSAASFQQLAYGLGKTVQFLLPVVWWWVSRPHPEISLRVNRGLAWGAALGGVIGLAMGVLYAFVLSPQGVFLGPQSAMQEKVVGLGLSTPTAYITLGVFYALAHAGLEEYYWRWFVFGDLRRRMPVIGAAVVSSLGFMAHHVILLAHYFGWGSPWTYFFAASVAVGGFLWAMLYQRWQSLLGPWISHMVVDAAIFTIGYYLVGSVWQSPPA